jgi:hypothetical protein
MIDLSGECPKLAGVREVPVKQLEVSDNKPSGPSNCSEEIEEYGSVEGEEQANSQTDEPGV